jgi:molybdopterin molybdotransferase
MASPLDNSLILSFEDARHLVESHAAKLRPTATETADLLDSCGHILAEPVVADRDFPPFRRAARDGYAVRAEDLGQLPATLTVVGEIKAGVKPDSIPIVQAGQAAAIMTGAPAPEGADAVVMVEYTSQRGEQVQIERAVESGANIVPAGSEAKRGSRLLAPGMYLDHAAISVAASAGKVHLEVYVRPQIAVLSTGDEIVDIDMKPGPTQIRNSNSYSLAAQIERAGGEPVLLEVAPDEPKRLRELIAEGLKSDLLLLAGGVSMGKYDLVEQVLAEFGAEFLFTGAKIQPGKPIVFGRVSGSAGTPAREWSGQPKYFLGLPGNPVSTMVTFELFARPMLEALAGRTLRPLVFLHAKLKSEIRTKTGLTRFLPAMLSGEFDHAQVELAPWHGSGDMAATALANCYAVLPPDRDHIAAGEWVAVLMR